MHRKLLLDRLERYLAVYPDDRVRVDHVQQFVRVHEDCFERSCQDGHVTGSAWIVSPDHSKFLLTHHRKFERWLQLGGHADGDPDPLRVALREAREESGLPRLDVVSSDGVDLPFDVDVHLVPASGREPAHLHHDIRYLLVAAEGQELRVSDESIELRWFAQARADEILPEGLLRMARRARDLLQR